MVLQHYILHYSQASLQKMKLMKYDFEKFRMYFYHDTVFSIS